MLSRETRREFVTLLDAVTLQDGDRDKNAIVFVETGQEAIRVSQTVFRKAVSTYAGGLLSMGIRPGDLVVIAHTQNLESIYSFWGAMLIGAIPSMFPTLTEKLDAEIYMHSMAELARLSDVSIILTSDDFASILEKGIGCRVVGSEQLFASISKAATAGFKRHDPRPEEIAFLQHSSGTTGLQKGVALSHEAVLNQLASYADAIRLSESDTIVSWLPLYHDMGLIAGFLLPLTLGVPLVLMSPFDWVQHPAMLFWAIHDFQGTLCWLPNFAYNHCARRIRRRDTDGLSAATMRLFINCSEPVYDESHQLFLERFVDQGLKPEMLAVSYAMAENTFGVTQTPPDQAPRLDIIDAVALKKRRLALPVAPEHPNAETRVSCGPPIAGTAVRVLDETGRYLPERTVGEIAIQSDCLLSGYYKRPGLSPFQDGWYLTGDKGYLAGGEVYVVGRFKDLIINAGKNIFPQDIEAIVNEVPGVHAGRAVVFGVPDRREGTELITVVAELEPSNPERPAADEQVWRKEVTAAIRRAVVRASSVTVSYVHLVDPMWLIKTSSGKIARAANREKWLKEM